MTWRETSAGLYAAMLVAAFGTALAFHALPLITVKVKRWLGGR